mmetsp:Transcript_14936/g.46486  ORF Transcript_14936/g.46486 Transcript_14936/m.46486 type:complete len:206 (+) Transcript_14936:1877-2494(+)
MGAGGVGPAVQHQLAPRGSGRGAERQECAHGRRARGDAPQGAAALVPQRHTHAKQRDGPAILLSLPALRPLQLGRQLCAAHLGADQGKRRHGLPPAAADLKARYAAAHQGQHVGRQAHRQSAQAHGRYQDDYGQAAPHDVLPLPRAALQARIQLDGLEREAAGLDHQRAHDAAAPAAGRQPPEAGQGVGGARRRGQPRLGRLRPR